MERRESEAQAQAAVFDWARWEQSQTPVLKAIPDMEILAYFVHFPYVNLKAAPGNKKPYYVLLEDMIEPINLTVIEGKGK